MYEGSQKSWKEQLKYLKSEKQSYSSFHVADNINPGGLQYPMKYTEPWIYGTVRGIPARPLHGPALFGPVATDLAVVVCSCPEYLSGTKRDTKKASICKKCKGSRLPLAPIGGTVRLRPTAPQVFHMPRGCVGTVRINPTSSTKSRPSIIDPQNDPYDLMRRSRLVCPDPKLINTSEKGFRNRAKSTSPNRGRSRNRNIFNPIDDAIYRDSRSRSAGRGKKEHWLDTFKPDPGGRRSILHCDVNPYELNSIGGVKHNNEFAPDLDEIFPIEPGEMKVNDDKVKYSNSLNIAGQRISLGTALTTDTIKNKFIGNEIAGKNIVKSNQCAGNSTTQHIKQKKDDSLEYNLQTLKPKRPPRRKQDLSTTNEKYVLGSSISSRSSSDLFSNSKQGIKSILKRPSSVTSSVSSCSDTDTKCSTDIRNDLVTTNDRVSVGTNAKLKIIEKTDTQIELHNYVQFPFSRKKVQFMVEDKIIDVKNKDEESNIPKETKCIENANLNCNYDIVQSQQSNHQMPEISEELEETKNSTDDTNFDDIETAFKIMVKGNRSNESAALTGGGNRSTSGDCVISSKTSENKPSATCGNQSVKENAPKTPSKQKQGLRRSYSERRTNNSTITLNFNDTMGLRTKGSRTDLKDVFTKGNNVQQFVVVRPLETSSQGGEFEKKRCSGKVAIAKINTNESSTQMKELSPVRDQEKKVNLSQHENKISNEDSGGSMRIKNPPQNYLPGKKQDKENSNSRSFCEDYSVKIEPKTNVITFVKANKKEQDNQKSEKDKLLQAQREICSGARIFANQNKSAQKTIVRVAPFNKRSSEVHRLKICHKDENNVDTVSQRKTSILINGDDCYSTVNVNNDTPIYQSSVVVTDGTARTISSSSLKASSNTVTINVSNSRSPEEEIIYKNNKINTLLNQNSPPSSSSGAIIPIAGGGESNLVERKAEDEKSKKQGATLITLDFDQVKTRKAYNMLSHEEELVKILRNPVEAVRRNLVPHVCGRHSNDVGAGQEENFKSSRVSHSQSIIRQEKISFIGKLLEDPTLNQLAEGLDSEVVAKLIENSLKRLKENRSTVDTAGTKDNEDMTKLIDMTLQKVQEERLMLETSKKQEPITRDEQECQSNRGSVSSSNSFSSANYELFDFDNNESDCYQSCSSEITGDNINGDDDNLSMRSRFYQMLVDATLSEIEISASVDDDHHYESIKMNGDPIYEEISDVPPPLPMSPPPITDLDLDKKSTRSMFEGASKYDILSYLVDAKERGIVKEEAYEYNFCNTSDIIVEEENDSLTDGKETISNVNHRRNILSLSSDSGENTSLSSILNDKLNGYRRLSYDIERNDSGVGSETSKSSRNKYQNSPSCSIHKKSPIHLCEDCDGPVETQITDSGVMYAPLVCRKCTKKRAERKEIITEIVETEEKYGRDLQIILEEFCQPMLVAGLLTQEQLSAIFLNTEELLENNQTLAERMRDALDIALEQGDDDMLTVNIGKIFLEATPMLHAFESYCVRQAAASLLLANLEKEKELLRIFLRVSQMENTVLRRMNLNSFLMVPVQRVTKYPLLLARLYKVTPLHLDGRELLKEAQEKIELHLNHMNQEAKDVPTKLWRRISSSSPNRRASCEIDMINIKLRKMAIDILEWNHDEVRFAMEGKLLFTQPTDSNWKKGRTIKLTPVNALLVTNGKPSATYKAEKALSNQLNFPKHTGIREASLLLVKEKCGRHTLIREPLYLDRCVVCTEADWDDYFEVHEILSKDTFIFKADDGVRTRQWYTQLQYHAQGMGGWRKRRNALANIMINGMLSRV